MNRRNRGNDIYKRKGNIWRRVSEVYRNMSILKVRCNN